MINKMGSPHGEGILTLMYPLWDLHLYVMMLPKYVKRNTFVLAMDVLMK